MFLILVFSIIAAKDIAVQSSKRGKLKILMAKVFIKQTPSKDFSRHTLVTPLIQHGRSKRELAHTMAEDGLHHRELTLGLALGGRGRRLDLRLKEGLVAGGHVLLYQEQGRTVKRTPSVEELDICQYSGKIQGQGDSWAALSTCRGLRGVIYDGQTLHYIEPVEKNDIQAEHYLYSHADLVAHHGGVTNNTQNDAPLMEQHRRKREAASNRYTRSQDETLVSGPWNANERTRYVELVLVADHAEYLASDGSLAAVHRQMKDVANIINSVYAPLNIFIALVGVVVWSERDEVTLEANGDNTLTNFLQYRKQLIKEIPNDNAHLITRQNFTDGVVGKAQTGSICTYNFSGGVSTNHSTVLGLVAATITHELGHNLGMEHDTDDCICPDEKCVMNYQSTSVIPTHWSSCSYNSLALTFERGLDYCLRNKPARLFDSPTCGNGFVEPGEQCDCGDDNNQVSACSACCEPATCLLRGNASCAAGDCCDLETCRPKPAGALCRAAGGACDLPEYCSGHAEFCPRDVHVMDATPCSEHAYCVRGECRSHTDQCQLLWGSAAKTCKMETYKVNYQRPDTVSNCGFDRTLGRAAACAQEDVRCGRLICRTYSDTLQFGNSVFAKMGHVSSREDNTSDISCAMVIVDLGLDAADLGLVPDGAKCSDDKICYSQKCVPVQSVREISGWYRSDCTTNCSGHGICNSEGHCHCEPGYAPPLCAGSYDSGSLPPNQNEMMYVYVSCGILLLLIIIVILIYGIMAIIRYCKKREYDRFNNSETTQSNVNHNNNVSAVNANVPEVVVHEPIYDVSKNRKIKPRANKEKYNNDGYDIEENVDKTVEKEIPNTTTHANVSTDKGTKPKHYRWDQLIDLTATNANSLSVVNESNLEGNDNTKPQTQPDIVKDAKPSGVETAGKERFKTNYEEQPSTSKENNASCYHEENIIVKSDATDLKNTEQVEPNIKSEEMKSSLIDIDENTTYHDYETVTDNGTDSKEMSKLETNNKNKPSTSKAKKRRKSKSKVQKVKPDTVLEKSNVSTEPKTNIQELKDFFEQKAFAQDEY